MPKLSDSMEEATILRWLKAPGEGFAAGDPLAEIETDKATMVYEAETDGVIVTVVVPEGASAAVGETIAVLDGDAGHARPAAPAAPRALAVSAPEPGGVLVVRPGPDRVRATPVARRRAAGLGVSLSGLRGTGPNGRITSRDVQQAASAEPAPTSSDSAPASLDKGAVESIALSPTQSTIAKRMTLSASTIPVFTVTVEIDLSAIVSLRRGRELVITPSVNDFVVRAAALALRKFPSFNSSYVDGRIDRYPRVNIGIAVAVDDALLVPTLFDADLKPVTQISTEARSLVERAKSRSLGHEELTQSTFTVSNLGMFGVHSFTAIVDPPQTAILAVGGTSRRPFDGDGRLEWRDMLLATLSADHRVVYGADGAAFLNHLKVLLEQPLGLML
jgi:pyruvate dehydrogenase E2 component (dihydrolipoamide acetyltransferase)